MTGSEASPKTILVAEDDPNDVALIKRAIRTFPPSVRFEFVADGEEAISYLEGQGRFSDRSAYPLPVLILLDSRMPKINGFEVLQFIRGHPLLGQLKVFVWADSQYSEHARMAKIGKADGLIKKPQDFDAFTSLLRELIQLLEGDAGPASGGGG